MLGGEKTTLFSPPDADLRYESHDVLGNIARASIYKAETHKSKFFYAFKNIKNEVRSDEARKSSFYQKFFDVRHMNVLILRPQPTRTFCFFAKILLQTRRMKTLRVSTCIYRSRRTNL